MIEEERQIWKTKLNAVESDYRNKLIGMERELVKQRERVTAIIEEKDKQLVNLQQHYFPVYQFNEETPVEVGHRYSYSLSLPRFLLDRD